MADPHIQPDEIIVHTTQGVRSARHRRGDTVLETLRKADIDIQTQCERAYCGSCIFQLIDGEIFLRINEVLSESDLADGMRLACQGVPEGDRVEIELF
ncbi:MAG: 2Fe-2S iron-sulfur cluster-binding protein [Beijerinckiaceae bacterium]|nr:2Fe-2S iron-sulfur cluster-binding protein [Beijerinckiaceae bacterium]